MDSRPELPQFADLKTVHIIGVCGTLMGSFAAFLKRKGIRVTGSDQNVYPPMSDVLTQAGVELLNGYDPSHLLATGGRPDLVVVGNVIGAANPEAKAAIEGHYAYSSLPEAMEKLLLQHTRNLVVAGTHGKTTTSSILAHVLVQCGRNPNYFIGGVSQDLPFSFQLDSTASGSLFVLEGDEYDTAFWDKVPKFNHYLPNDVILTSVEYDHADIYPNLDAVVRAFEGLVSRVRTPGRIIACYDYPIVKTLVERAQVAVISYGHAASTGARYYPGRVRSSGVGTTFEVLDEGKKVDEVQISIPGMHNVLNTLAVWIECHELGLEKGAVREALNAFKGVKRRQEVRGEVRGVVVIDDFAHHPTAVRETLKALKLKYPQHRLVSVFEPRSATSRRKVFQKDYSEAFKEADCIYIANPYDQSKISTDDLFSSQMLVDDLVQLGKSAHLMDTVESGVRDVCQASRSGDLIAVLSNGGFGGFIPKVLEALKGKKV